MTPLFYLTFGATIFSALALAVFFFMTRSSRAALQRVREITHYSRQFRRSVPLGSNAGRRFMKMVHWVRARLGLAADAELPERLANAGYKGTLPADLYTTSRILCPLLALVAGSFIPYSRAFWMIALPAAAYIAPNIALTRLVKRRREKIRKSIPDAIDLLVICVDAGLGIDQALLRVGRNWASAIPRSPKSCCRSTASSAPENHASRPGPTWPRAAHCRTSMPSPECWFRPSASARRSRAR